MPEEHLDVAEPPLMGQRHLVHRRHAVRDREARRGELQPLDLVLGEMRREPAPQDIVRVARDLAGGIGALVALDAVAREDVGLAKGRRVREAHVAVHPDHGDRPARDLVQVRDRGDRAVRPP